MSKYHAPKVPLLKEWHLKAIKQLVDEHLRIRCINVETTLKLVERGGDRDGKQHLELTSTAFNTVPVIHSGITVEEFGGTVQRSTQVLRDTSEEIPCTRFYLTVSARYEGNGTDLFTVAGQVQDRDEQRSIFFDDVRHATNSRATNNRHESDFERD